MKPGGIHIIEDELAGGGNFTVPVMAGEGPLRATLVWTDVPGTPPEPALNPPDLMLVNDLDMRISGNNQVNSRPISSILKTLLTGSNRR
jgi:hypothetical protein